MVTGGGWIRTHRSSQRACALGPPSQQGWGAGSGCSCHPGPKGKPRSVAGAGQSGPQASGHAPYLWTRKTQVLYLPRVPWKPPSQIRVSLGTSPRHPPPPTPAPPRPRRSFARAHREPGREREMSFPAARWRCQLIGRGRGPRAGLGASLAAAGAQLSGKNWGGRCGEISYRSLGGAAGPRSALTAADPGPARRAGAGRRGQGCWGWGGLPRPLPSLSVSPRRSSTSSSSPHPPPGLSASLLSPLPFIPPPWYRPKADPELTGILRPQHWPPRLGLAPGALSEC